jgi:hypothetical protein
MFYFVLGAAGADGALFVGVAGTAALFAGTMLSVTDAEFDAVYRYPSANVFTIKRNASVNVAFARKPVGPFAPNTDSLLPL